MFILLIQSTTNNHNSTKPSDFLFKLFAENEDLRKQKTPRIWGLIDKDQLSRDFNTISFFKDAIPIFF